MTKPDLTPQQILATPMQDNDAHAKTIYQYLLTLSHNVWIESEGFSGKRPFGNSGWEHEIYHALAKAGHIESKTDQWGDLDYNTSEADKLIDQAYTFLKNADPLSFQLPPEPKDWYVVDIDSSYAPLNLSISGPYTKEDAEVTARESNADEGTTTYRAVHIPN